MARKLQRKYIISIIDINHLKLTIMEENKNKVNEQQLNEVAGGVYRGGKEGGKEAAKEGGKEGAKSFF